MFANPVNIVFMHCTSKEWPQINFCVKPSVPNTDYCDAQNRKVNFFAQTYNTL